MINLPPPTQGLRHIALYCQKLEATEQFYVDIMGMQIAWKPDADNIYLTSGHDNLALHRAPANFEPQKDQRLDHMGFFLAKKEHVDQWHEFLVAKNIVIKRPPKDHRDGTRSFYCADPEGIIVQMIYIPAI
jgi:catechol 2,3-dioxygenase-like lactoylglutathione lyase family enzyme